MGAKVKEERATKNLTDEEWALAFRMYALNAPPGWIARFFNTSRQAVWDMFLRKGVLRDQPPAFPVGETIDERPVWDRWRRVILAEMIRQQIDIAEVARRAKPEDNVPMARRLAVSPRERAIYSALRGEFIPKLDTLQSILAGLGKSWGWVEREAAKLNNGAK